MVGSEVLTPDGFKLYYHKAQNKKHDEIVVFVHHMWGNHKTTWRHFRHLNDQGYDCVSFDLVMGSDKKTYKWSPVLKYLYKGVFYIWTRQIRSILNFIEGDKIIFAFSGPSLSAFWASHDRTDVKKFICDGGPFEQVFANSRNFFSDVLGIKNPALNYLAAYLGTAAWGYQPLVKLHKVLNIWPKQVPILSIRGKEDNIVALKSIDAVFTPHPNLNLSTLELEKGKHLDGMREFPTLYIAALERFLAD